MSFRVRNPRFRLLIEDGGRIGRSRLPRDPAADGRDEMPDAVAEGQRQEQGDEQDGEGVGGRGYSVFPFI